MTQAGFVIPKIGLDGLGLKNLGNVYWNLTVPALYEEAIRRGEGQLADGGAFVVRTGVHTGRSPNDKFFVDDSVTHSNVDWGKTNKPMSPEKYRALYNRMIAYAQRRDLFVRDCWAGADPAHRIGVRVINETAWHNMFARNMFLRPDDGRARRPSSPTSPSSTCRASRPIPSSTARRRDCAILVNFTDRVVAICGTWYAGEIKKSVFTILNYLLPEKNILPMHASANIGPKGDVAIFFGLSRHRQDHAVGRSVAHPDRRRRAWLGRELALQLRGRLLRQGDQAQPRGRARDLRHHRALRHGAGERGDRSGDRRPRPRRRPATPRTRAPAIRSTSSPTRSASGIAGTPENIVMLTADAFGVLPPISRLSRRSRRCITSSRATPRASPAPRRA